MPLHRIPLSLPFRLGRVNCYLLPAGQGFVLVDTGGANARAALLLALEEAGCLPDLLRLIILTHGDFDHSGNAAYLRENWGCRIAMHAADAGMVERGDMFVNRKQPNPLIRRLIPLITGFGNRERFTPDLLVEEGDDLNAYELEASVLSIPGHSKGSIGVLTSAGDFFCGDLLTNSGRPALNSLIDDAAAASASLHRLGSLRIDTVYPGHGAPFMFSLLEGSV